MAQEVKNANEVKPTANETKKQDGIAVIVNDETAELLTLAFSAQGDYENESKFIRVFLYDAAIARIKYMAQSNVNAWKAARNKYTDLHPTVTKEQAEVLMLESRKARELKELADKGEMILAELK